MFKGLRGLFSDDLSIDLGTANTLIYVKGKGIVLDEPSIVAIRHNPSSPESSEVAAVGNEAKLMLGRTPENISTIQPLKDGTIADFKAAEKMLQHFIKKIHNHRMLNPSPRVLVCVPCEATQIERRAIRESALGAGAREVYLIDEPMAAALGAGLPVHEAHGSMVIDIGGGTTEIAIISLNGVVYASSVRIGGDTFDESIISYLRRNYGILVGEATAEKIKKDIGVAYEPLEDRTMKVRGRNISEGLPRTLTIRSSEILDALQEPLQMLIQSVHTALESAPPELASDIAERGIVLTGGSSLLCDLDKLISEKIGLPVMLSEDPLTCVVRGGGMALEYLDAYGKEYISMN